MFSTKIRWVRFADSYKELATKLNKRNRMSIMINESWVLLIHHNSEFYLVKNKCPHQGSKLDHAVCEKGKIVCPWHHYGFDLKTGRGHGLYLENYPIEEREDGLYAGFEYFSWF